MYGLRAFTFVSPALIKYTFSCMISCVPRRFQIKLICVYSMLRYTRSTDTYSQCIRTIRILRSWQTSRITGKINKYNWIRVPVYFGQNRWAIPAEELTGCCFKYRIGNKLVRRESWPIFQSAQYIFIKHNIQSVSSIQ